MSHSSIRPPDPNRIGSSAGSQTDTRSSWSVPPATAPQEVQSYRVHAYVGMLLGLFSFLAIFALGTAEINIGPLFPLISTACWIYSGWFLAKARGYHPAWGLLGLIGIIGLLILSLFPDRYGMPLDAAAKRLQLAVRILLVVMVLAALGYIVSM